MSDAVNAFLTCILASVVILILLVATCGALAIMGPLVLAAWLISLIVEAFERLILRRSK